MAKAAVIAGWGDVPHIDPKAQEDMLATYPAYQRAARSKGIPQLGSGVVYPYDESDYTVPPIALAPHWPRYAGLDVGYNRTACVWLAHDRDAQVHYVYAEHYGGKVEMAIHAGAIRERGDWIPIAADPASRGRSQADGIALLDLYEQSGLDVFAAPPRLREAGITQVATMLSEGRLKVSSLCKNLLAEMRIYRRDEKGNIVKANDHACDALRYAITGSMERAIVEPSKRTGKRWCDVRNSSIWAG